MAEARVGKERVWVAIEKGLKGRSTRTRYGVPYKGSKSRIARWVYERLPRGRLLYDLFAGGCAVTDYALRDGSKFSGYVITDLQAEVIEFYKRAVLGGYEEETRWISREEFFALKESDPYIKYCWSFGDKGTSYLYGVDRERIKKAIHFAAVNHNFALCAELGIKLREPAIERVERDGCEYDRQYRLDILRQIRARCKDDTILQNCSLQGAVRLERVRGIAIDGATAEAPGGVCGDKGCVAVPHRGRLQCYGRDYREVPIEPGSVVYCDIPYVGTDPYTKGGFNHKEFYDWACGVKARYGSRVYISEYWMPPDRFALVDARPVRSLLARGGSTKVAIEKLYTPIG